jgi:DNA repair exonuclease SbcCD ATPase subunit
MLPLHEVLRHDAPIDIVRVLVELKPETLLIPNKYGRTAEQMASKAPMRNAALLQYLRETKDAYVHSKRTELEKSRRDEARSVILMVMPNQYVDVVKKLRLEATDFSELTRLVGAAVKLDDNVTLCKTTADGSVGDQYIGFDDLGEVAKVMVWPSSLLASADNARVPNEDEATFAAAASIVSSRAAEEQDTRMVVEEERMSGVAEPTADKIALLARVAAERDAAQRELQSLRGQLQELQQAKDKELAQCRADATVLQSKLESATKLASRKDQEIVSLRQQLSDQATAAEFELEMLQEEKAEIEALQSEAAASLQVVSAEVTILEQKKADAETKVKDLVRELQTKSGGISQELYDKSISELEATKARLGAVAEEQGRKVTMLEQEKAEAEAKVKSLTDKLAAQGEQVSKELVKAASEAEALAAEVEKVREKYTNAMSEHQSMRAAHAAEMETLRKNLTGSSAEVEMLLRTEIADLRATQSSELAGLRLKLSAASEELEFVTKRAHQKEDAYEAQLTSERRIQQVSQKAMQDLRIECDRLQQKVVQGQQQDEAISAEKTQDGHTTPTGAHAGDEACDHARKLAIGPIITEGRQLGVPPSLRRQLRSVAAVQKITIDNDSILSIAAELALWPAVRNAEATRKEVVELRHRVNGTQSEVNANLPEGVPRNS